MMSPSATADQHFRAKTEDMFVTQRLFFIQEGRKWHRTQTALCGTEKKEKQFNLERQGICCFLFVEHNENRNENKKCGNCGSVAKNFNKLSFVSSEKAN